MTRKVDPPYYELDVETRDMLESALNVLGGVADLQMDDDSREDMYALGDELATRFGVASIRVDATEGVDADGNDVVVLTYNKLTPPPKLTIVSNNDLVPETT